MPVGSDGDARNWEVFTTQFHPRSVWDSSVCWVSQLDRFQNPIPRHSRPARLSTVAALNELLSSHLSTQIDLYINGHHLPCASKRGRRSGQCNRKLISKFSRKLTLSTQQKQQQQPQASPPFRHTAKRAQPTITCQMTIKTSENFPGGLKDCK